MLILSLDVLVAQPLDATQPPRLHFCRGMNLIARSGLPVRLAFASSWSSPLRRLQRGGARLRLEDKIAVITGGNSGIGLATARRFVEEGAFAYITGRRQGELDKVVAVIGRNAKAIRADVSEVTDLDRLFAQIGAEKGKIDVLVANAGFVEPQSLGAITAEHFDKTCGINARGTL